MNDHHMSADLPSLPRSGVRHTVQFGGSWDTPVNTSALAPLSPKRAVAPTRSVQFGGQTELEVPDHAEHDPAASDGEEDTIQFRAAFTTVEGSTSCLKFVEKSWFQAVSAVVIITNVITTILEMDKPHFKKVFFISDQLMLAFYVVELYLRASYFRRLFLCGPRKSVMWNILDIVVVVAGVFDQWLMPALPVEKDEEGGFSKILQLLRLLRLLRVFKIVRVFLDIDLSWTEAPAFQSFIGIVIMVNSLLMGVEIDIPWSGWFWLEQVLLCIYVFELSVRLKNFGKYFFSCDNSDIVWNTLDFIIVSSSVLDSWLTPLCGIIMKSMAGAHAATGGKQTGMSLGKVMMLMRMLRLMRILRLAKLIKSVRPLFVLVTGVAAACQGVAWVLVLTIVTLYAMGILATSLIGKKMAFPPGTAVSENILKPFGTVPDSMFTLFRVMSGAASDSEQAAIDDLMDNVPSIKLGFVFFMISSSWTLLSILTAVVSENMISTTGQQEEEHKIANAEEDRHEHVAQLKEIFENIDATGDGEVERHDIEAFLSDKNNAVLTARRCRVPVRDVREVLQTVAEACDGTTVSLEKFVENLADVSNVVTEKSVMKIEAKLSNLSRSHAEAFLRLNNMLNSWKVQSSDSGTSELERVAEALQSKADAVSKSQLAEIEKIVQGLTEKTEACLRESHQKNQGLFQNMTEALEYQFGKMHHDLLCSMRGQEAVAPPVTTLTLDQHLPSTKHPWMLDGPAGPSKALQKANDSQPGAADKNQADDAKSSTDVEAQACTTEKIILDLQRKTESMLRKNEGLVDKMSRAVEQGFSALAAEKLSETLQLELRTMRQDLFCLERPSPDIYKGSGTTDGGNPLFPVMQDETDLASNDRTSGVQTEAGLLANEESFQDLQHNPDAMFRKIEALLEQGIPALAIDKFSEAVERELYTLREVLALFCSLPGQVSKVKDELQKDTGPAAFDTPSTWPPQELSVSPIPSTVEGNGTSSPGTATPILSTLEGNGVSSPGTAREREE